MLIRFVVENFLSFKQETEFNMLADNFRIHPHHLYKAKSLKILKGSVIYGANGAGKSNLIKSVGFFQNLVSTGKLSASVNPKKFKLDPGNAGKPVNFEIEFYFKRKIYHYGVQLNDRTVENEWLYISGVTTADKMVFERKTLENGKSKIKFNAKFLKTPKDKLLVQLLEQQLLQHDELLLGHEKVLNQTDISNVKFWFTEKLVVIYPDREYWVLFPFLSSDRNFERFANRLLIALNTGVNSLEVESIPFDTFFGIDDQEIKNDLIKELNEHDKIYLNKFFQATKENDTFFIKKLVAQHVNNLNKNVNFDLTEESDGTQRLLDFIPAFYQILHQDVTFVIDEIDRSIHPALIYELVKKIMNEPRTKGQLIFTTHESNLLDLNIFRQDEIWFAEKNDEGATELYSLSEFRPRPDLDLRKGYLKGRFGAIPFTGDLKNLDWNDAKKTRV